MSHEAQVTSASSDIIVAKPATYYRMTRYVMVLAFVGMGLWFCYDGWIGWPYGNQRLEEISGELTAAQQANDTEAITRLSEEQKKYNHHKDTDILLQKVLGFVLPPLGIVMLVWALYNSRGVYRLSGQTLEVPGHPPVSFDHIRRLDKQLWDRKGIAYVDYDVDGQTGRLKLDDFVYERKPTDDIYKRIDDYVTQQTAGTGGEGGDDEASHAG